MSKITNLFLQKSKFHAYWLFIFCPICFPKSGKVRKKFHFLRILKLTFYDFEKRKSKTPPAGQVLQKSKSKSKNVRIPSIPFFLFSCTYVRKETILKIIKKVWGSGRRPFREPLRWFEKILTKPVLEHWFNCNLRSFQLGFRKTE